MPLSFANSVQLVSVVLNDEDLGFHVNQPNPLKMDAAGAGPAAFILQWSSPLKPNAKFRDQIVDTIALDHISNNTYSLSGKP